jgi:hypothetical protein
VKIDTKIAKNIKKEHFFATIELQFNIACAQTTKRRRKKTKKQKQKMHFQNSHWILLSSFLLLFVFF